LLLVPDDERENKNMQAIESQKKDKDKQQLSDAKARKRSRAQKETATVGTPTALCRQQPALRDGSTTRPVTTPPSETTARPDYQNGRCWI